MKKISTAEAVKIVKLAAKLIPDVLACVDGISEAEGIKLAADAVAVVAAIQEALKAE